MRAGGLRPPRIRGDLLILDRNVRYARGDPVRAQVHDGQVRPLPWGDFAQLLAQVIITWAALVPVLLLTRGRPMPRHRGTGDDGPVGGVADLLEMVRPRDEHRDPCPSCAHPLDVHDVLGRCTDAACLALGDDQVCHEAVTALRALEGELSWPDWTAARTWTLFCRLCGHRMAHHGLERSGRYICPPGAFGPFHDSPAAP